MHDGQAAEQAGERKDPYMGGCCCRDDGGNDLSNGDDPSDVVERLVLIARWLKDRKPQTVVYMCNTPPRLKELDNLPAVFEFNRQMNVKFAEEEVFNVSMLFWGHRHGKMYLKKHFFTRPDKIHLLDEVQERPFRYITQAVLRRR